VALFRSMIRGGLRRQFGPCGIEFLVDSPTSESGPGADRSGEPDACDFVAASSEE